MKIKNYKVSWKHNNHNNKRIFNSSKLSKIQSLEKIEGSTECYLTDLNNPEVTFTGKSICHQNDNYNKRLGRYLSFRRAINQINDENERQALWNEILPTGLLIKNNK